MANPLWEAGPDLALLFLCMKLILSGPQDGLESSQHPLYVSAKRFISLLEATGTATLLMLQANILVTWYEYGQAIYPAAYMTAGWCTRYGNMLGISGNQYATDLLGRVVRRSSFCVKQRLTLDVGYLDRARRATANMVGCFDC
jgi:hypothetical protein